MQQQIKEKQLKSGGSVTMTYHNAYGYEVDCWDEEGNNRWNRAFSAREKAEAEYGKWS